MGSRNALRIAFVVPAKAGIQWRFVINQERSLGSGLRRSDQGAGTGVGNNVKGRTTFNVVLPF
ncbi:MAG: hypothetical protein O2909_07530 [Chloroflexi bacterium]|nr:hypothetical protein [Chloroflexota bacterium]